MDPIGKLLSSTLAMMPSLVRRRMRSASNSWPSPAPGPGQAARQPKLSPAQEKHLVNLYKEDAHTLGEIAALFAVTHPTVYRALDRAGVPRARRE